MVKVLIHLLRWKVFQVHVGAHGVAHRFDLLVAIVDMGWPARPLLFVLKLEPLVALAGERVLYTVRVLPLEVRLGILVIAPPVSK